MRRIIILILLCLAIITVANAQIFVIDNLEYEVTEQKEVSVAARTKTLSGDIIIPASVNYQGTKYTVRSIKTSAFSSCNSLSSVSIPNSVTKIGNWAFYCCKKLKEINVSADNICYSSVDGVLYNKDKTTLIRLPEGKSNQEFIIPNSVTEIGESAFYECTSLASVTIPNSVTEIGNWAFYCCTSLASVTIPNSVSTIGQSAFYGCTSLASVTIPNSVTEIGGAAFYGCTSLASVHIPNSVTTIGWGAFRYCTNLSSVTIGKSVTQLNSAFKDCPSLKNIYCLPLTPPTDPAFEDEVYAQATLYVHVESKGDYMSTEPWSKFQNIVATDFSGVDNISNDPSINIKVENGRLIVTGLRDNEIINIYNLNGTLIHYGREPIISSLPHGMYIVKAGGLVSKIVF